MTKKLKQKNQSSSMSHPPIVTILGHVDHGKTTLLDYIRKTRVAQEEAGGITQGIGAYQAQVETKEGKRLITFIDTPGHEAFMKMRSRGVNAADIAVLVVAADDGVMPQTKEAVNHIQEAKIPFLVAINKVDLPGVDPQHVKRQLAKLNVLVEGYGGDVVAVPISGKTGQGVEELLEMITLINDLNPKQKKDKEAFSAVVIESRRDSHRGPVASLVVKTGSLLRGDDIMAEQIHCRVRNMFDERGMVVTEASTGKPVEVLGWDDTPPVGALVTPLQTSEEKLPSKPSSSLPAPVNSFLKLIIKAHTVGALEAIGAILPTDVTVLSSGIGDVNESDVLFAKTTGSIILGFNVRILPQARKLAGLERVIIKTETIIYKLIEEVKEVIEAIEKGGLEEILGQGKILANFLIKHEQIAGVALISGRLARGDSIKITRDEQEIGRGRIRSLRIGKKDVSRVEAPGECGVALEPKLDFNTQDAIIAYRK